MDRLERLVEEFEEVLKVADEDELEQIHDLARELIENGDYEDGNSSSTAS